MHHLLTKNDWELLNASLSIKKGIKHSISIFSIVPAWIAKNSDGSPSGWKENTPEGDRLVLEEIRFESQKLRYVNHWNWQ